MPGYKIQLRFHQIMLTRRGQVAAPCARHCGAAVGSAAHDPADQVVDDGGSQEAAEAGIEGRRHRAVGDKSLVGRGQVAGNPAGRVRRSCASRCRPTSKTLRSDDLEGNGLLEASNLIV